MAGSAAWTCRSRAVRTWDARSKSSSEQRARAGYACCIASGTACTPLQITCPRRGSKAPALTAKTPRFGLWITAATCASSESGSPLLMWCSRPGDRRRCTYRRRHGRPRHLRLRRRPAQDPHRHPGTATCQARRAAAPQPRPLTIHEVKRLLADALSHPNPPGHAAHWLEWRCRHQARTRRHHQRARLVCNHVLVS